MCPQTVQQTLIITGITMSCFSEGFIFGQMSGMIDDLRSEDSEIKLSDDEISWIASIINIICFCGFGLMTIVNELLGRGKALTISMIPVIISWIMVYFAEEKVTLITSRITAGLSFGGISLLSYMIIGEYLQPKMRALYLNITVVVGMNAGTMVGHVLSTFIHWRNVALIGLIPSILSAILPLFWVESPSWLAVRGRLEESVRAYKRLHNASDASDSELKLLLINYKDAVSESDHRLSVLARKSLEASKTIHFWKLCLLIIIIVIYRVVAGRIFFSTFAITMIQDISRSSSITNFTLFVDGFMLTGALLACFLVRKFEMRHLIIILGTIANTIQVVLIASLYFWQGRYDYIVWIKVALLALYFIIVNAGPYAVMDTLFSEIFPLDIKGFLTLMTGIVCGVLQFSSIKLAPCMLVVMGYHGVFVVHALITFGCLVYLYVFLPETKGRNLQEIESYFRYNTFEVFKEVTYTPDKKPLNLN